MCFCKDGVASEHRPHSTRCPLRSPVGDVVSQGNHGDCNVVAVMDSFLAALERKSIRVEVYHCGIHYQRSTAVGGIADRVSLGPQVHACRLRQVIVLIATVPLMFQLLDFPPLWWVLDAHSLWHLGTIPLPYIWYR